MKPKANQIDIKLINQSEFVQITLTCSWKNLIKVCLNFLFGLLRKFKLISHSNNKQIKANKKRNSTC